MSAAPVLPWNYHADRPEVGTPVTGSTHPVPALFEPLKIRGVTLKNRIAVSPMCMYTAKDGFASDFHVAHLGSFAIGGAALVIEEATAVQPHGRITPYCNGLWSDEHIAMQSRIVNIIHSQGAAAGIQIGHAGRKASTPPPFPEYATKYCMDATEGGWPDNVVGPSSIPWNDGWYVPREMSVADIHECEQAFVDAARRADKAGFDWLEIHAAHGYLLHSFYSAHSNHRTDEYGGSLENRCRFLVETAKKIREVWPANKVLAVRLSCTDWIETEDGWDIEQTLKLVDMLIECGVDVIDTSSGGNAKTQVFGPVAGEIPNDYQTKLGARVKELYGDKVHVGPVGRIRDGKTANHLVESKQADFVHVGRQFLRDPHFVATAAKELDHVFWYAPQYEWSTGQAHGGRTRKRQID